MANPQAENGHTDIANELMEALAKTHLSGNEWKILITVMRKTWGWHKKSDCISLTQFEETTGLSRPNVHRAIKQLVAKQLLVVVAKTLPATEYAINKDYDKWTGSKIDTSSNLATRVVAKPLPQVVAKPLHTKERKETIQKKDIKTFLIELINIVNEREKPTDDRITLLASLLKDYSQEEIKSAAEAFKQSTWHRANGQMSIDNLIRKSKFGQWYNKSQTVQGKPDPAYKDFMTRTTKKNYKEKLYGTGKTPTS